jgi:hypothetical protein
VLPDARRQGVQVWPLGFGPDVQKGSLAAMASGGFGSRCPSLPGATPRAQVVDNSSTATRALQVAFAASRCARIGPSDEGVPPTDLHVDIPVVATDGSITVVKRDPRVVATYYDPKGQKVPSTGRFDDSVFDLSGQDGPVEVLRIRDPRPGRWRIQLTTPNGGGGQLVSTSALWQGVLRSSVVLDPPSPGAGEQTTVSVVLRTRRDEVISDPDALAGVQISARLTGTGFAPVTLALADDGKAPDIRAADGQFSGGLTVPATASGNLDVVADVIAEGITGDQRPISTQIRPESSKVTARPTVEGRQAYRGESVAGTLAVRNDDSRPHTLTLALTDLDSSREASITPTSVEVQPGSQSPVPFTVTFGRRSPLGQTVGRVVVIDETAGATQIGATQLIVDLREPPPRWPWVLGGSVLLLVLVTVVLLMRRRRVKRGRDPNGLVLRLQRDGDLISTWRIRTPYPDGFGFGVVGEGAQVTVRPQAGGSRYVLRRHGSGVELRTPAGATSRLRYGEAVGLGVGVELVAIDESRRRGAGSGTAAADPRKRTDRRADGRGEPLVRAEAQSRKSHHPDM